MEATLLPPAGKAADPYACIGTKNAKHVQNCLELYMNDRGIDYLPEGVFERFIDLKYLWLMRNNLAKLENLDENFRLHCLYLSLIHISEPTRRSIGCTSSSTCPGWRSWTW